MTDYKNRIVGSGSKPASQFQAHPNNWRKHPKNQRAAVRGSLESLGWIDTVIENVTTGRLIDGHERVWNALQNGDAEVPFIQVELTEAEEAQALLSLDAIAALAETDREQVDALLRQVETDNADVMQFLTDFAKESGLEWGQPEQGDAEPQIDRAAELLEKWKVETGDLWQIGSHKLLCGDSTVKADVDLLMQGELCGACVTDSPYGINREGIENDDPEGLRKLFDGVLENMPIENGVIINFQSPRLFPVWLDAVREAGHKFERMLWMYKSNDVCFTWRGWLTKSECIILSSIGKAEWEEPSEYSHDCYSINWDKTTMVDVDGWHASIKPPLIVKNLVDNTVGIVYEPFAGSGTTMVACQNLNRKCRAIEISPAYCSVILERMSTAFPDLDIVKI